MTSYGVYGHLLDSLSAWGHSVTLFKPEQARFGRLYASMFFRKASPQTEGRRDADLTNQNVTGRTAAQFKDTIVDTRNLL